MVCTFFGHRNASYDVYGRLKDELIALLEKEARVDFLVGNNGNFDKMAIRALKELSMIYDNMRYAVVLAYLPKEKYDYETIYPEGLESVPPRFAISRRNDWMVAKADLVIGYIKYSSSGAGRTYELAERKGKIVINIA